MSIPAKEQEKNHPREMMATLLGPLKKQQETRTKAARYRRQANQAQGAIATSKDAQNSPCPACYVPAIGRQSKAAPLMRDTAPPKQTLYPLLGGNTETRRSNMDIALAAYGQPMDGTRFTGIVDGLTASHRTQWFGIMLTVRGGVPDRESDSQLCSLLLHVVFPGFFADNPWHWAVQTLDPPLDCRPEGDDLHRQLRRAFWFL